MNAGKKFENCFRDSIPSDTYFLRLNDPAQSFSNPDSLRFSLKNPFDCLLFRTPYLYAFELKSTLGALSFYVDGDSSRSVNIKRCQIEGLQKASQYKNCHAGLIFNFRESAYSDGESTYFLPINVFMDFRATCGKKSINEKDIVALGSFTIPQTKKRTKYSFDVDRLLDHLEGGDAVGEYMDI